VDFTCGSNSAVIAISKVEKLLMKNKIKEQQREE
jgi:hypothetical protein